MLSHSPNESLEQSVSDRPKHWASRALAVVWSCLFLSSWLQNIIGDVVEGPLERLGDLSSAVFLSFLLVALTLWFPVVVDMYAEEVVVVSVCWVSALVLDCGMKGVGSSSNFSLPASASTNPACFLLN